jgi:hypothetical protein
MNGATRGLLAEKMTDDSEGACIPLHSNGYARAYVWRRLPPLPTYRFVRTRAIGVWRGIERINPGVGLLAWLHHNAIPWLFPWSQDVR